MAKNIIGIDIGSCTLKLAMCEGDRVLSLAEEHMPDNLVRDGHIISPESMADFLKASLKKNRFRARLCAVIIPASQVFVRQTSLPYMTEEQLKLNLPYEFRDFITDERDKYFYDYYVVDSEKDSEGAPVSLELVAAAVQKELISQYNDMCRWAGLKLVTAIPAEMALVNLIRRSAATGADFVGLEQCFIDLGHTGTRIFFYRGERFDAVRSADRGGIDFDNLLSEKLNVDVHIAQTRKELEDHSTLDFPELADLYRGISTEIMRAVNFYSYNNPGSELSQGWFCGGGYRVKELCDDISSTIGFTFSPISEIIQGSPDDDLSGVCFAAIGAAIQ